MRSLLALVFASIVAASSAWAETRVFIIANQPDGYGVDRQQVFRTRLRKRLRGDHLRTVTVTGR